MKPADIVDLEAIADMLNVKRQTVSQWRLRGILPPALGRVSGCPYWLRETVSRWAEKTGRSGRMASEPRKGPNGPQIDAQRHNVDSERCPREHPRTGARCALESGHAGPHKL